MVRCILIAAAFALMANGANAETGFVPNGVAGPAVHVSAREPLRSEAAAKAAIEAQGYRDVRNLRRDPVGNWAGEAVRDGFELAVILQLDGEIAEE